MSDAFLAVLGHTNIDVQIKLDELPVPVSQSRPVLDRRTVYGGTACNIARHAANLGVPTRLWSRVGQDFPNDWKVALLAAGLNLDFLDISAQQRTPTCYVLTDLVDRQSYIMDQGAMGHMVDHPPSQELLEGLAWLHIGTGAPAAYTKIAAAARKSGVKIAFDPGQEIHFAYDSKSFQGMLDASDVFFCNDAELAKAFDFMSYGDPVQLLDHVDAVVVTHGEKGATLYQQGAKKIHLPAHAVTAVDPTGAGDALRAGWYAGLQSGKSYSDALQIGMATAAVCVGFEGPQTRSITLADVAAIQQNSA